MNRTGHRWVFAMYLLAVGWSLSIGWAQDKPTSPATEQIPEWEWVPTRPSETRDPSLPATVKDGFTFAAGGDLLGFWFPRTPLADPGLAKVLKIFKDADVVTCSICESSTVLRPPKTAILTVISWTLAGDPSHFRQPRGI